MPPRILIALVRCGNLCAVFAVAKQSGYPTDALALYEMWIQDTLWAHTFTSWDGSYHPGKTTLRQVSGWMADDAASEDPRGHRSGRYLYPLRLRRLVPLAGTIS